MVVLSVLWIHGTLDLTANDRHYGRLPQESGLEWQEKGLLTRSVWYSSKISDHQTAIKHFRRRQLLIPDSHSAMPTLTLVFQHYLRLFISE